MEGRKEGKHMLPKKKDCKTTWQLIDYSVLLESFGKMAGEGKSKKFLKLELN